MTTHFHNIQDTPTITPVSSVAASLNATHAPERVSSPYKNGLKRFFDVFAILCTLPFVLPIIGVLALITAIDGGKPFYQQKRVGKDGKIFVIWKLRTMVQNADQRLEEYLASNREAAIEWQRTQKLKKDPRITFTGRYLRKCSLDELPQLLNVLLGDMSLVGPRPMMPEQKELYPGRAYYTQRPGITGSWQVSKRNEAAFTERARFDTDYVANMSFLNDFSILLQTVRVVLRGTGY